MSDERRPRYRNTNRPALEEAPCALLPLFFCVFSEAQLHARRLRRLRAAPRDRLWRAVQTARWDQQHFPSPNAVTTTLAAEDALRAYDERQLRQQGAAAQPLWMPTLNCSVIDSPPISKAFESLWYFP